MYNVLSNEARNQFPDIQFTSLAARVKQEDDKLMETFAPVSLDPKHEEPYVSYFFKKHVKGAAKLGAQRTVAPFFDMCCIADRLNAFMGTIGDIVTSGEHLSVEIANASDEKDAMTRIESLVQTMARDRFASSHSRKNFEFESLTASSFRSGNAILNDTQELLGEVHSGRGHYLRPSEEYKDGIDIVLIPHRGSSKALKGGSRLPNIITLKGDNYDNKMVSSYLNSFCISATSASEKLITELFGNTFATKEAAVTLPTSFDFSRLQEIFEQNTGVKFGFDFFEGCDVSVTHPDQDKFLRMMITLNVNPNIEMAVNARYNRNNSNWYNDDEAQNNKTFESCRLLVEKDATREGRFVGRSFSISPVYTFNKHIARYIAQQTDDGPIDASAINNWFAVWSGSLIKVQAKKGQNQGRGVTSVQALSYLPRHAMSASSISGAFDKRKELGMSVEESRTTEEGLYLNAQGSLNFLPKTSERDSLTSAKKFQELTNKLYEFCFEHGINPIMLNGSKKLGSDADYYMRSLNLPDEVQKELTDLHESLYEMRGSLISYDWDTGVRVYASDSRTMPGVMRTVVEAGAKKPDILALADSLGFSFNGKAKSFNDAVFLMSNDNPLGTIQRFTANELKLENIHSSTVMELIIKSYIYFSSVGKVRSFDELVSETRNTLRNESDEHRESLEVAEKREYLDSLSSKSKYEPTVYKGFLRNAFQECAGNVDFPLARRIAANTSPSEFFEEKMDHPWYFDPSTSPANKFVNVYNTFGGLFLCKILQELAKLSSSDIITKQEPTKVDYEERSSTGDAVESGSLLLEAPTVNDMTKIVIPFAIMYGKYALDYDRISEEAEQMQESNERDDSVDIDDVKVAGAVDGFSQFPHQLDTHRYLRKPKPPAFAVLDIGAGGGKTAIGLTDISSMVEDLTTAQSGQSDFLPLVLCPSNLVGNWCNDMRDFTNGTWNMIPITSASFKRWGAEALREMIKNAPRNTIVVVGFDFLKSGGALSRKVTIGNGTIKINMHLEFIRSLRFNYILIDESHKLKNKGSAVHRAVKQLTSSSFVQYLRIASGTIISDRVKDVEGQVALYSPSIFRTGELVNATGNEKVKIGGEDLQLWKVSTPQEVRSKLQQFASVVTKKKKDWAFMLPTPIETLYKIDFEDFEDPTYGEFDRLHYAHYDAVLQKSLEELDELVEAHGRKQAGERAAEKEDAGDEAEDDDDNQEDDDEVTIETSKGTKVRISQADLDPYLARLERLTLAPHKDPLFEEIFGNFDGGKEFISRKCRKINDLVKKHYNPIKFNRGMEVREGDVVSGDDGFNYTARKRSESTEREMLSKEHTDIDHPSQLPEIWKKEPKGKIIIFVRYKDSVETIYESLPEEYRNVAVRFSGNHARKYNDLERFKKDDKVQILIAVENGLAEGHNLQIASRIIRVELPWGPGELEQSASRIFRPDPKGASQGEIYRDVINLDWVITDRTMEVAKMGRLISKIFAKTRFDEAGNPLYSDVLAENQLGEISLSIKLLKERPEFDGYMNYVQAYGELNEVIRTEFMNMRAKQKMEMAEITHKEVPSDFRSIQVPFVPQQRIPDPKGWKPEDLQSIVDADETKNDRDLWVGSPVITDRGLGMIVGGNNERGSTRMSSVKVRLRGSESVDTFDLGLAFIPQNISAEEIEKEFSVDLNYTQAQQREAERKRREEEELERQIAEAEAEEARESSNTTRTIVKPPKEPKPKPKLDPKDIKLADEISETRKQNIKDNMPVNTGVTEIKGKIPVNTGIKRVKEYDFNDEIELHTVNYGRWLAMEVDGHEHAKRLKALGFREVGEFAYVEVKNYSQADYVCHWLEDEKHFHLTNATINRLENMFSAFDKDKGGRRAAYMMERANLSDIKHFFEEQKRSVKDAKQVRWYPVFHEDRLWICADLATNRGVKKWIGKKVKGANVTVKKMDGMMINFAKGKPDARRIIKDVQANGFDVVNLDQLKDNLAKIKFRKPRNS